MAERCVCLTFKAAKPAVLMMLQEPGNLVINRRDFRTISKIINNPNMVRLVGFINSTSSLPFALLFLTVFLKVHSDGLPPTCGNTTL